MSDAAQHHVFAGDTSFAQFANGGQKCFCPLLIQALPIELVERVEVYRIRLKFSLNPGTNAVFIRSPSRELGQILHDALGLGMKYMRPIAMHKNAVLVIFIISVSANMGTLINHQHPQTGGGEPLCAYAARISRPHY